MITIKDIAQTLGVSTSTVARALGDHPRISDATKHRVQAAAAKLGYVAHAGARTLRGQPSNLIGLIVPDVQNAFYSTIAAAISQACDDAGYQLVLSVTDDKPDVELRQVRGLFGARVAGVVLVISTAPGTETIELLRQIPHVQLVRRCKDLASDWFGFDDEAILLEGTRHLLGLGHRRIGIVTGSPALSTTHARLGGFRRAHEEAGVDIAGAIIESGLGTAEQGRQSVLRLLACEPRPTALITANTPTTVGMAQALASARIDVPGALSVLGFNDAPSMAWWGPGLTTIGLPVREIALSCSTRLLRRIRAHAQGHPQDPDDARPVSASHLHYFVLRGSTAPPAARPHLDP